MDIDKFINKQIIIFLYGEGSPVITSTLVKRHAENLSKCGDFSFPIKIIIWQKNLKLVNKYNLSQLAARLQILHSDSGVQCLVDHSKCWPIPIQNLRIESDRCLLYLNRSQAIRYTLKSVFDGDLFRLEKISGNFCFLKLSDESISDLQSYRAQVVGSVLDNLASSFHSEKRQAHKDSFSVIDVRPIKQRNKNQNKLHEKIVSIYCGDVLDDKNQSANTTPNEYISLRAKDMQLMAMHKYGLRVKNEVHFRTLIESLGNAAARVDLLEAKHTSPVALKRNSRGSTKGASFILYNSARIETLLRKFEDQVQSGVYPPLPDLVNVDINLLIEEEEWMLIFSYILAFPSLVYRCLAGLEDGKCAPHLLVQYVCGLVGVFSVYYRRVRVLLDGREHLIPLVHARIYLVKGVREVLNRILCILSIDPVQCM